MASSQLIAIINSAMYVVVRNEMGDRGIPVTWAKMHDNNKYCVDRSTEVNRSYSRHFARSFISFHLLKSCSTNARLRQYTV